MGCSSCGSGGCQTIIDGVRSGGCGQSGGCASGGCNRLNAYDWLSDMGQDNRNPQAWVEIKFKGGRKDFYKNAACLDLYTGDAVVVTGASGYHIGYISLQGPLVALQMQKKTGSEPEAGEKNILRLAVARDIEKLQEARNRELPALYRTRQIISENRLKMKLSDVEFQADNTKATFYYSAEDRVDFRELIKSLAGEFRVRVEMRQISLRQEAGRLGGIGTCGRELCCSTWLHDFKSVSTSAARYQNLSLNPVKLSGQCGRLKCCLNYELDTYMDALKDIPQLDNKPILTEKGEAWLHKTDIFKRIMWFGYKGESNWHAISVERVNKLLLLNAQNIKAPGLTEAQEALALPPDYPAILNEDLQLLDKRMAENDRQKRRQKPGSASGADSGSRPNRPAGSRPPIEKSNVGGTAIPSQKPSPSPDINAPNRHAKQAPPRQNVHQPQQHPPTSIFTPTPSQNLGANEDGKTDNRNKNRNNRNRNRNNNNNRKPNPDA